MAGIGQKIKHELGELIPPTLFFFVAFQLLAFTQAMMLREYGISTYAFLGATIGALVVAKVVLLSDLLPFVNRFPEKPLIYNVVWKTAIYFFAALGVRYVEHFIHFFRAQGNVAAAHEALMAKVVWPHFWVVQVWLLVLLLVYCALRELVRALGRERVVRMFFIQPPNPTG